MDMHVAIVADVKQILERMGHEVDLVSLSGHAWVLGQRPSRVAGLRLPTDRFSRFRRTVLDIDDSMCNRFYEKNKTRFANYDAFIVSYPPAFALLFEKFGRPVITVNCTRFDFPCQEPERLTWLISGLERMHGQGQLLPIANNRLDQVLASQHFSFDWRHVPSLCDYMTTSYQPKNRASLLWARGPEALEQEFRNLQDIDSDFTIRKPYDRENIHTHAAVVHLPYQISIMAAFEHYAQAIPMLVPSKEFLMKLYSEGAGVLSEVLFPSSSLSLPEGWVDLADYYDEENFAHMITFDSLATLEDLLASVDFFGTSELMSNHHAVRRQRVHQAWLSVLESHNLSVGGL